MTHTYGYYMPHQQKQENPKRKSKYQHSHTQHRYTQSGIERYFIFHESVSFVLRNRRHQATRLKPQVQVNSGWYAKIATRDMATPMAFVNPGLY